MSPSRNSRGRGAQKGGGMWGAEGEEGKGEETKDPLRLLQEVQGASPGLVPPPPTPILGAQPGLGGDQG